MTTETTRPFYHLPTLHVDEAAMYLGVSLSQFKDQAEVHGLFRQATHGHYDRAALAKVLRMRGMAVDRNLTKGFRA